eukprot:s1100_g7.t1
MSQKPIHVLWKSVGYRAYRAWSPKGATSPISLHTFADALNEAVAVGPELVAMRQFSEADIQCMRPPNQMPKAWSLVECFKISTSVWSSSALLRS